MVEGYRVTMPSGGSAENGYEAAVLLLKQFHITISLDYLLRVFTPIAIRAMGFYLCLSEQYKVLRKLYRGHHCPSVVTVSIGGHLCPLRTPVSLQTHMSILRRVSSPSFAGWYF